MEYFEQWQHIPVEAKDWQNEPAEQAHPGRAKIHQLIKDAGCSSVLEVACGIGIDYPRYKQSGITYYGVDVTPKFIEEAQRRGVPCKVADARQLPFPDRSFDAVYCKDLLIHLPPNVWRKVLSEMARVARLFVAVLDDQWVKFTDYQPCERYQSVAGTLTFWNNRYSAKEVCAYAEQQGLNVKVYDGGSVKRIHVEGDTITPNVMHPSQITVYTKRRTKK